MLGRYEFLFAILTPWIITGITYGLLRGMKKRRLPPGSFVVDVAVDGTKEQAPGTRLSRVGVNLGHFLNDITLMVAIIIYVFDLWASLPLFFLFGVPVWVNWIGILGIWFQFAWQIMIIFYNVNFTANYKSIEGRYVLATGGPYRLVRHPTYINYVAMTIFVFLATGIWISLLGSVGWIALPYQAKLEEATLEKKFNKIYTDYAERTGRFFPKIRPMFSKHHD